MHDVFIIPQKEDYIVYAPLLGILFDANSDFCAELTKYLETGTTSEEFLNELNEIGLLEARKTIAVDVEKKAEAALSPNGMIFLFSDSCNLRCKYCFASSGEKLTPTFNQELTNAAVEFVINNAKKNGTECSISFHGGGEPTYDITWLKSVVNHANRYATKVNMAGKVECMIVTNGFVSEETARWLSESMSRIQVSIDGYPEIQNDQRPTANGAESFEQVFRTIKILEKGRADLFVRSTISRKSQDKLPEIARFLCKNINVEKYYWGTVNNYGRAAKSDYCEPEPISFVLSLIEAQKVANQYGKKIIICTAQDNFPDVTYEYCGATNPIFGLTKDGNITACPEVISPDDKRKGIFWYGKYDPINGEFVFDGEKITSLVSYQAKDTDKCCDCFAKYQCAGDCRARWYDFETCKLIKDEDFRCIVNRSLVEQKIQDAIMQS